MPQTEYPPVAPPLAGTRRGRLDLRQFVERIRSVFPFASAKFSRRIKKKQTPVSFRAAIRTAGHVTQPVSI
jgi:hypothetical protein